jgi:3-methylcrotonyl-CoA carboxylase alpha subunit
MFAKLLIANRGEIACRIMRTARRMGIRTVAVYSAADAGSRHVAEADEAVLVGAAPAAASYLDREALIDAVRRTGAEAVHPGYGFLSENAEFAQACADSGAVFVGPSPAAISAMGEKHASKDLMVAAGVPVVPGYHGENQSSKRLCAEAETIGYPVLIKATAGGGGKGMRVVETADEFERALAGAKREAESSFGSDRVLLERYLTRPRHIEIQVFADSHGEIVHLFERECSIQRRHQKVIEEAPAPGMTPALRQRMGGAAIAAARAIGYVGAGTVEFIVEGGEDLESATFYFMEMNTRLQVEHPVTEMITGLDLVEWQLRVAAGEPLPLAQEDLGISGHSIETRIYAENPAKRFLPAPGRLERLRMPEETAHVRIDTGVREGDVITPHYDPLIAKLIVWDEDRGRAVRRMGNALQKFHVVGTVTNRDFLYHLVHHAAFRSGDLDTGFIDRHLEDLVPPLMPADDRVLAVGALAEFNRVATRAAVAASRSSEPGSPWFQATGWRLNGDGGVAFRFVDPGRGADAQAIEVRLRPVGGGFHEIELPEGTVRAAAEPAGEDLLLVDLDDIRTVVPVYRVGDRLWMVIDGIPRSLIPDDARSRTDAFDMAAGDVVAPLPGRVAEIQTEPGAHVRKGMPLLVIEAMKMEHTVTAPADGVVAAVRCLVGDSVEEGVVLVDFERS